MVGMLTNITFAKHNVRYIAINDNFDTIDPNSVDNDFAGIKNWFNEFYARDTSRKIRAVIKAKGERGEYLVSNVPFGYLKSPDDSKTWIVDEEASKVVKYIFRLCMEGRGPTQIAKQLEKEKIPTVSAYKIANGRASSLKPLPTHCEWNANAVVKILERREYTGCTVNFKTYTNSIWDKTRRYYDEDQMMVFPNTHPAIIDPETFNRVQEIRSHRHRRTATGKSSMFSGLIFCNDCGGKMYYCTAKHFEKRQDHFVCSNSRGANKCCTVHFIRAVVLEKLVWEHMKKVIDLVSHYEDYFRSHMKAKLQVQTIESISILSKKLSKSERRLEELDRLYIRLYEDNVNGKISDEKFSMMASTYENEQKELKDDIYKIRSEIESQENRCKDLETFIQTAHKYIGLKSINAYVVHELIKGIYVEAPDKSSGHRVQKIHIQYDLVGFIPVDEMMERKMA